MIRALMRADGRDRTLLASAAVGLWLTRVALWVLPFAACLRRRDRLVATRSHRRDPVDRVAWAVERAAVLVPASTCLVRALTAEVMLRRRGHDAQLHLGVARSGASLEAHAWLESDGRAVIGGDEAADYVALPPLSGR